MIRRLSAALVIGAALGGCATPQQAQITTFYRAEAGESTWAGKRFVVQPQASQRDSLAFSTYADAIRAGLQRHGLVPVSGLGEAQLVVHVEEASASTSTAESQDTTSRISFGLGGGYRTGWGIGIGVPIGASSSVQTYYRHQLQVFIHRVQPGADGAASVGERLYESTIVTNAGSPAIAPQMPGLIEAWLSDFPGQNGKTRTVEIPAARSE